MNTWQSRMVDAMRVLGISKEKELAGLLGVSPQAVNQFMKTGTGLGAVPKLKLLELLGEKSLGNALDEIEPGRLRPPGARPRK